MARKKRKPITLDGKGEPLGGFWDAYSGSATEQSAYMMNADGTTIGWIPSSHAGIDMWVLPSDQPMPTDRAVSSWTVDSPAPGLTTWFSIDPAAYTSGNLNAAAETIGATASQIAAAGGNVVNALGTIATNFVPILIGLAVLFFMFEAKKTK